MGIHTFSLSFSLHSYANNNIAMTTPESGSGTEVNVGSLRQATRHAEAVRPGDAPRRRRLGAEAPRCKSAKVQDA